MREQDEHHANANAQRLVVRCVRLYLWERVASKLGLSRRHPGDQWRHCVESHGLLYDLQRCKWKLKGLFGRALAPLKMAPALAPLKEQEELKPF